MLLNKLFKDAPKIDIKNIMVDSRQYKSSSIYFCIKGLINDGHKFIDEAIQNGAIAAMGDPSAITRLMCAVLRAWRSKRMR